MMTKRGYKPYQGGKSESPQPSSWISRDFSMRKDLSSKMMNKFSALLTLQIVALAASAASPTHQQPPNNVAFQFQLRALPPGHNHHQRWKHESKNKLKTTEFAFASHAPSVLCRPTTATPLYSSFWSNVETQLNSLPHTASASSLLDSMKLLRGGALTFSLPALSNKAILTISKVLAGYVFFLGAYLLLAPVTYASYLKGILMYDVEEDTFDSSLLQSIGAIILGFATHTYLVLSNTLAVDGAGNLSLNHAMGYAMIPRIVLIVWSFLRSNIHKSKGDYQFEGTQILKINFFVMSWTAFSLFTGAGNPDVSAKVFSTFALIKAMALVLKPVQMTQKLFGVDVGGEEMTQSCFLGRALGNYLSVHAILMLALAIGVNPHTAVGLSSLAWIILPLLTLCIEKKDGGFLAAKS